MTIQYISDLHLERKQHRDFFEKNPIKPHAEYLILAGDIIPIKDIVHVAFFLDHISRSFKQVFWLPGNHEFYGSDYSEYQSCSIPLRANVLLINNQSVKLAGFELVFSTLWSNLDITKRWLLQFHINDFKYIGYQSDYIDAIDYNGFHQQALAFINSTLEETVNHQKIVVTHYCPIPLQLKDEQEFCSAYYSQLNEMIIKYQPMYWLYGHTHTSDESIQIGKTHLITNQFELSSASEHLSKTIDF